jgi:non-specific serine/threonine protein kinase/serine/threonine-protein kinase
MNPERWQRVKQLLDEAIALDDSERAPHLDQACAADSELRREVESLLSSHRQAGTGFLNSPAITLQKDTQTASARAGRRIGVYQIVEEIGHGGMGEVYRGVRADGLYTKEVAVKLVRGGFDTAFVLERFRTERQILASLDHVNIARLLDGGTTEDGIPYLVMELIEGMRIDLFCDERKLSITQRLQLFRQVCAAVQYAHQRLVIHRDIKPGNILVTKEGVPKLLDFGIAKILDPAAEAETTTTIVRPMTPEYASPEQIRGEPITTASDVYSLGVVLYQLLTGRSPYSRETRNSQQLARAVCETDPGRPSAVVLKPRAARAGEEVEELSPEQVSKPREGSPAKLHRRLAGDLDNIVLKALRKEPQQRYGSAEQFSEDLRRHLEGRPITASKGSWNYRAKKFIARNRTGFAAGAAILLVLLGGIAATTRQARIARAERARAENRLNDVRRLSDSLIFDINDAIQTLPGATPVRKLLLDRAVQYLDSCTRDAAGNPDLQRELANGYRRLAAVQGDPTQSNLGEEKEALNNIRKALSLFEEVARANPENTTDQVNVAAMHRVLSFSSLMELSGQRNLEQAMAISARLLKTDGANPNVKSELGVEYQNLGLMQDGLGNRSQAVESLRKNLEIKREIFATTPDFPTLRLSIGVASVLVGSELARAGSQSEALQQIESGIAVFEGLTREKNDLDLARRLAIARMKRGEIQMIAGDVTGARESFRAARLTLDPMAAADPQNFMLRLDIAGINYEEARILATTGDFAESETRLRLAASIFEKLHAPNRTMDEIPHGLGAIYIWQGEALAGMRNFNGALESYQKAAIALEASPDHTPENDSRCELVVSFTKIGDVLTRMGRLEQASAAYKKAVERIEPPSPPEYQNVPALYAAASAYRGLGDIALARTRQNAATSPRPVLLREARESYEKSLAAWKQIPNPSHVSPLGYLADDPRQINQRLLLAVPSPPGR